MNKIFALFPGLLLSVLIAGPTQAECIVTGGRVVHGETNGTVSTYWVAPNQRAPTFYYVFTTGNAQFIDHLNAAHAAGLRVTVQGTAGTCGSFGALRSGGSVLQVSRDSF